MIIFILPCSIRALSENTGFASVHLLNEKWTRVVHTLFFKFRICKYLSISFFNLIFFTCLASMKLPFPLQSPIPLGSFPASKSSCWAWAMAAITAHPCAAVSWQLHGGQGLVSPECHVATPALAKAMGFLQHLFCSACRAPVPRGLSFGSILWAALTAAPATLECLETWAEIPGTEDVLSLGDTGRVSKQSQKLLNFTGTPNTTKRHQKKKKKVLGVAHSAY